MGSGLQPIRFDFPVAQSDDTSNSLFSREQPITPTLRLVFCLFFKTQTFQKNNSCKQEMKEGEEETQTLIRQRSTTFNKGFTILTILTVLSPNLKTLHFEALTSAFYIPHKLICEKSNRQTVLFSSVLC